MRSAFFEFNVAISGLYSARGGLDIVNHNIANAETPGYSRQFVEQRASWPITYYDGRGMIGTGSQIYGVGQIRDVYLDMKYWHESSVLGEYQVKYTQMGMVERVFREMSGTGTSNGFDVFFKAMQELTIGANDGVYRTNVLQASQSLTKFVNSTAESLVKYQRDINEEVKTVVMQINSIGNQIVSLNSQIAKFELDGSKANDLRDQRAKLIDELSLYVNVEVKEVEMNQDYASGMYPEPEDRGKSQKLFFVSINGYEFVKGSDVRLLECVPRDLDTNLYPLSGTKKNPMDADGLYDIYFRSGGGKFDIYSPDLKGQLKGLIDTRDGNNEFYVKAANNINVASGDTTVTITPDSAMRLDLEPGLKGTITITVNGIPFDVDYNSFTVANNGDYTFNLTKPLTFSGNNVSVTAGKTSNYKGIPHYMDRLNELVRTFALAVNEGLDRKGNNIDGFDGVVNGYDVNGKQTGVKIDPATGLPMIDPITGAPVPSGWVLFTYKGNTQQILNYNKINCLNFSVNQHLIDNPLELACATKSDYGESANDLILKIAELKNFKDMFAQGKISDYIIGIAGELAVDVDQSKKFNVSYYELTETIDYQRQSVSKVDISEETTNLIRLNQIYQASAKLINIIDQIYDTTINRMGVM